MSDIDLKKYQEFVDAVTSQESKNNNDFQTRWTILQNQRDAIDHYLKSNMDIDEDNIYHMKRELGDVIWYWMQGCMALNIDPNDVIQTNIDKLKSRYPGGNFFAHYSENRKEGDI